MNDTLVNVGAYQNAYQYQEKIDQLVIETSRLKSNVRFCEGIVCLFGSLLTVFGVLYSVCEATN